MKREIKASEVREGMEVEWTSQGWYHRGEVATVKRNDHAGVWVQSSDGFEMSVEPDQVFTVLAEPQPDEPTAFGACVKVAGKKYVRVDDQEPAWVSNSVCKWNDWADILKAGHVTVINPDPFANTEPREPRVWETWADVPEMTPIRVSYGIETIYRKREGRVERRRAGSWVPALVDEYDLNERSPLTEVLVSTVS